MVSVLSPVGNITSELSTTHIGMGANPEGDPGRPQSFPPWTLLFYGHPLPMTGGWPLSWCGKRYSFDPSRKQCTASVSTSCKYLSDIHWGMAARVRGGGRGGVSSTFRD